MPWTSRRVFGVAAALVVVLATGACGDDDAVLTGDPVTDATLDDALAGRTFASERITVDGDERPLVPDTRLHLTFGEGQVNAQAGCNTIGGVATVDDGVLVVGELFSTDVGCAPELHDQDAWVAELLEAEPRAELEGDRLRLVSGPTVVELVDRVSVDPDRPLVGTGWMVDTLIEGEVAASVPANAPARIELDAGGTIDVHTGCNAGEGEVVIDDATIVVSDFAVTEMACAPEVMTVEATVLAVLGAGPDTEIAYAIDGPRLRLDAGEHGLGLRAED